MKEFSFGRRCAIGCYRRIRYLDGVSMLGSRNVMTIDDDRDSRYSEVASRYERDQTIYDTRHDSSSGNIRARRTRRECTRGADARNSAGGHARLRCFPPCR